MDLWITTTEQATAAPDLAAFLLDRLASLVARRDSARGREQRVALARGTFSVFLDCRDLGLGTQADAILARGTAADPPGRALRRRR